MDEFSKIHEIPKRFIDLIKLDENIKIYSDLMLKIMASDLRCLIVSLGDAFIRNIENGFIKLNDNEKDILRRLVTFYNDPIKNETNIFQIFVNYIAQRFCK